MTCGNMRKIYTFWVVLIVVLFNSCATKRYDWLKPGPDKVRIQKSVPSNVSQAVKKVDIIIDLEEKVQKYEYAENFEAYPSQSKKILKAGNLKTTTRVSSKTTYRNPNPALKSSLLPTKKVYK